MPARRPARSLSALLEIDDQIEEKRQKLEESLYYLGMIQSLPAPTYKQIADQNCMEAWKQHYKPILIGKRLVVVPAWMDSPDPKRIPIKIDPGMAFGTGTHPTTQLCLELMEKSFDNVPKAAMKKDGNEVCIQCHARDKIGLNKKHVHTVLKRGRCTECHDPHATQTAHLLKAAGDEACFKCHKKDEHQRKVAHAASPQKGCLACHSAHGSDEKDLLVKAGVPLCLTCQDATKGPFKKAHAAYPVEKAASCTGCHNPHSSTQVKLLKASAHDPVKTGQCEICHKPATAPKPFEASDAAAKLCANCHDAKDLMAGGKVDHVPFKDGQCTA